MSEDTLARTSAERAAIERWEGEGGRSVALEDSPRHQVVVVSAVEQMENVVLGGEEAQGR